MSHHDEDPSPLMTGGTTTPAHAHDDHHMHEVMETLDHVREPSTLQHLIDVRKLIINFSH